MKNTMKKKFGSLTAKLASLLLAFGFTGGAGALTVEGLELPNMQATILDTTDAEFPNSNLNELTQPLDHAVHFAIPLTAEQQTALNGNYFVDFVLKVNKDVLLVDPAAIMPQIQNGTLTVEEAAAMPAGCIVGAVNPSNPWWIAVPTMGQMQLSANTPYRVCSDMAAQGTINWTLQVGPGSLWGENESGFLCGIWFTPGFHAANPDLVITLEPRLYKYNVEDQSNPTDMGSLGETLRFPAPHVTIIPPAQEEPTAVVAAIDNGYFTTTATEPATIDYSTLLPNLSVEFNAAAVQQIATTAGDSSIRLKIEDVTESGVTDSKTIQITLVDQNDNPVYAEGTAAGTATVTVPFAVESGKVPVVYYVNGTTKTKVDGATYNSENQTVSFTVTHFSEYEIAAESEAAPVAQVISSDGTVTNKFTTVSAAVAAATAGETVEVFAGTFEAGSDTIVVDKAITITGAGKDTTTLNSTATGKAAFSIQASNVTIENMTINQADTTTDNTLHVAIAYTGSSASPTVAYSDVTLQNLKFTGSKYSVSVYAEDMTIDSCDFVNPASDAILLYCVKGDSKITNNTFTQTTAKGQGFIYGTTASGNDYSSGTLTISGNTASGGRCFYHCNNQNYIDTTTKLTLTITDNEVIGYNNKAIVFAGHSDIPLGTVFNSVTVTNNAIYTSAARPTIQRDDTDRTTLTIDASGNYWGAATPDFENLIPGTSDKYLIMPHDASNIAVESWYQAYDEDTDTLSNLYVALVPIVQVIADGGATTNEYASLDAAFAAANEAGTATIKMLEDVDVTNVAYVVSAGNAITLDLNGKTVKGTDNTNGNFAFITNKGTFTIDDTSENHDGELVYGSQTPNMNPVPGYGNYTIENEGTLTIVAGTVRQTTRGPACYAVNNSSRYSDAVLNMQGGLMTSPGNAIRAYGLSDTYENVVNVSGGSIAATGAGALWVQLGSPAPKVTLNVTGGSMSGSSYAFFDVDYGNSLENVTYNIQGGTFTGEIFTYGATTEISGGTFNGPVNEKAGSLTISGGTFNGTVEAYDGGTVQISNGTFNGTVVADDNGTALISGGQFASRVRDDYCADGYIPTDLDPDTGMYTVTEGTYVAQIVTNGGATTNKYASLADAVAAVPTDGTETTVQMIADYSFTNNTGVTIAKTKNVVLDLNGYVVSHVATNAAASQCINNNGTLTIKDSSDTNADGTGTGKMTTFAEATSAGHEYANDLILNSGEVTVESGHLENISDGGAVYVIDHAWPESGRHVEVNIDGGYLSAPLASGVRIYSFVVGNNDYTFNMTGGKIEVGGFGIQTQSSYSGVKVTINISGGTVISTFYVAIYDYVGDYTAAATYENMTYNITGGTFSSSASNNYKLSLYTLGAALNISGGVFEDDVLAYTKNVNITDGEFNAPVNFYCFVSGATLDWAVSGGKFGGELWDYGKHPSGFITGGIFTECPDDGLIAEGYEIVDNTDEDTMDDYPYTVAKCPAITFEGTAPDGVSDLVLPTEPSFYNTSDPTATELPAPTYTSATKTFAGWMVKGGDGTVVTCVPEGTTGNVTFVATWSGARVIVIQAEDGKPKSHIKVTDDWLAANNFTSETDDSTIEAFLEGTDANGLKRWENYVLEQKPTEAFDVISEQGATTEMPVALSCDGRADDTGFTVKYRLDEVNANGTTKTAGTEQTSPLMTLDLGDVTGAAYYRLTAVFTAKDESGAVVEIHSANTIGVLAVTSAAKSTIIAVPWASLESNGEITVSNLVRTATLTAGDMIQAYDAATGKYKAWELSSEKAWEPVTVVGGAGESAADAYAIPRGAGVWLTRQSTSQPVYLVGGAVSGSVVTPLESAQGGNPSWNLVANPGVEAVDIATLLSGKETTASVVVPTAGAPKNYTYKDGAWGYDSTEPVIKNGKQVGVKSVRKTGDTTIPAGTGFWYLNSSEAAGATIAW